VRCELRHRQPNEPRERRPVADLNYPEAETVPVKVSGDALDKRITLFP
jgi:hypothetical protein